jgi:hypothetical protein
MPGEPPDEGGASAPTPPLHHSRPYKGYGRGSPGGRDRCPRAGARVSTNEMAALRTIVEQRGVVARATARVSTPHPLHPSPYYDYGRGSPGGRDTCPQGGRTGPEMRLPVVNSQAIAIDCPRATARVSTPHPLHSRPYYDYGRGSPGAFMVRGDRWCPGTGYRCVRL